METEENRTCPMHKVENDLYCLTCNKAICLYCKCVHPKDHMQIIHLAELAANMIIQVKTRLETLRGAVTKEYDEIASMIHEFDEDKRYLYTMMKRIERMVVQMLHTTTATLTKTLQRNDEELRLLKAKIEAKVAECSNSEKLLQQLMELNSKKDYWQIYLIQDRLKKGSKPQYNSLFASDLKKAAIKEAVYRGQQPRLKSGNTSGPLVPMEIIAKKEELRKVIAVTDYSYLNEVGREMNKALNTLYKRLTNEIMYLKQSQSVVFIKNNPDPLIRKHDKAWLSSWILGGRTAKLIELELIYKGTKDGFGAADFHAKCDGKAPTLVLISAAGKTFGGYTTQPWAGPSPGVFKEDANAFTFSLSKKVKCGIQAEKRQMAVRHSADTGPAFGAMEISISDNNTESHATGGSTYILPGEHDPKMFYADNESFRVNEVEVYRIKFAQY
eukprot:TRINITY_DN706_c0_g1_i1.p1 TRINITY_DN706_c0_g1~~TRINITY_DN706_c0_g1_i1.p1  ORF type:complete len:482 (-),score=43.01 TRINITY_DN706_c0_g1_i1:9971-11296(-)